MFAHKMVASCLACALALPLAAQDVSTPAEFPEFSAKRVKPPKPGTKRRITVQIDPDAALLKQLPDDRERLLEGL